MVGSSASLFFPSLSSALGLWVHNPSPETAGRLSASGAAAAFPPRLSWHQGAGLV